MSDTYYATRPLEIQSHKFAKGDVLGTGDVEKGQFTATKGLEKIVECGHVLPRLADGRVSTEKPTEDPPASKPKGSTKSTKKTASKPKGDD